MATATLLEDPIAMVVEDREKSREDRVELLRASGFRVLSAENATQALQDIQSIEALDLVVTDIHLDPTKPMDRSGVKLAETIRKESPSGRPRIPVVGYSAFFEEGGFGGLQPKEIATFDDYLPKASSTDEIRSRLSFWRKLAIERRNQRANAAAEEVKALMAEYQLPRQKFDKLLQLRLESDTEIESTIETSAEDILSKAGYHLHIIEPGTPRPLLGDPLDDKTSVISPFAIWVKRSDDVNVAEVNEYPMLYGFGNTEDEAITEVLLLMDGFRQELIVQQPSDEALIGSARKLRDFLKHVFG